MNTINKFNALKKKIAGIIEEGDKLSKYLIDISNIENEVYTLNNEIRNNEDLLEADGYGSEELCEELWELTYEAKSWLPSSMQC